jgi:hypothetical protein
MDRDISATGEWIVNLVRLGRVIFGPEIRPLCLLRRNSVSPKAVYSARVSVLRRGAEQTSPMADNMLLYLSNSWDRCRTA